MMKVTVEVLQNQTNPKFEKGKLYRNPGSKTVVLCTKNAKENSCEFKGVCINPGNRGSGEGEYCESWSTSSFEPFCGKIILEQ